MALRGGCQCGRVRYEVAGPLGAANVCYCRMCQKASGAPLMAFVEVRAEQVAWSAPPAVFASSNAVERGFCPACGTSLTYRAVAGETVELAVASLDDPEQVRPRVRIAPEAAASWLAHAAELPAKCAALEGSVGFVNHQAGR